MFLLAASNTDSALVAALENAHEMFLTYSGDPLGVITEVLDAEPNFVMGQIFRAAILTQAMETRIYPDLVNTLKAAEALPPPGQRAGTPVYRGHPGLG